MSFLSGKRLLFLGFVLILIIGIPATVYLALHRTNAKSGAQQATTISFDPVNAQENVGDTFTVNVIVDPGGINLISFIKLNISYDPTKLATAAASDTNTSSLSLVDTKLTLLQGPVYTQSNTTGGLNTISATISVGSNPTNAIQNKTTIATLTFKALDTTNGAATPISFGDSTQILSIGASDQASENVLLSKVASNITIAQATSASPTPTPISIVINNIPTPTSTIIGVVQPTTVVVPSPTPTDIPTPTLQPTAFDTPVPEVTLEATGPGNTIIGAGAVGIILMIAGAAVFFIL